MGKITGWFNLELELSALLSLRSLIRTGSKKTIGTPKPSSFSGQSFDHYHGRRDQHTSTRAHCVSIRVLSSAELMLCFLQSRGGDAGQLRCWTIAMLDNYDAGQSVEGVKGGEWGWLMYPCSKGMCHSWPGAHSQHWRWMPGGSFREQNGLWPEKMAKYQENVWLQGRNQ